MHGMSEWNGLGLEWHGIEWDNISVQVTRTAKAVQPT